MESLMKHIAATLYAGTFACATELKRGSKQGEIANVLAATIFLALTTPSDTVEAQPSRRILETTQPSTIVDKNRNNPNWARDVCNGKTAFTPGGARYEWTPVVPGFGQYGSIEAASGWALLPHDSDRDVPFTHPFGKRDFNYFLLPDVPFAGLLAPNNKNIVADPDEREGQKAKIEADTLNLVIGAEGLLGVEQDVDLIPEAYRPRKGMGDRVAVFGRWIIDCGHDNWHSEIHPPLLTAVARPDIAKQLTHVDIIANPYLVDQEFSNGGVLDQLAHDLALVNSPLPWIPFTDRVSAQASFLPSSANLPSRPNMEVFSFVVRPPAPAPTDQHSLHFRMHLTARSGVIVQPFWIDRETVGVVGLFNDQLRVFPITGTRNWDVTGDELTTLHPTLGKAWNAMVSQIGGGLGDIIKAAVLSQGIRAILYDKPTPPDISNAPVTQGFTATNPWGQNPVTVNNNQPYPLIGWMEVQWRLPPAVIGSGVPGTQQKLDRHLDEIRKLRGSGDSASIAARNLAATALLADIAPPPLAEDRVSGEWRYRIQGASGQASERGVLWLRVNGSHIQGAIDTPSKRQDLISGNFTGEPRVLHLLRSGARGASQRIVLNEQNAGLVGIVEGTQRAVELSRPK